MLIQLLSSPASLTSFLSFSVLLVDFFSSVMSSVLSLLRHLLPVLLLLGSLSVSAAPAAAPVSVAPPPPPPMVQLTPQIPLTGFVARMQESSKYIDRYALMQ